MQTVNIAELKNNLSAYLEQVKNGAELIVKDRNRRQGIASAGLVSTRPATIVAPSLLSPEHGMWLSL